MANFYIEKVVAKGNGKADSVADFGAGLNIIRGYSDTGKTCIAKCISFAFGGSELPFDAATGYDQVVMNLKTDQGRITFRRKTGKNQVEVESEIENVESTVYDIAYKKNQKKPVLNDILLQLMGIEGVPMIVSDKLFNKKRLTWKNLFRMLYINEDDIARSESIIVPTQYTEKTLSLSLLLYLITGRDFAETDAQTKKEIKVARKKAVEEYVNRKIAGVTDRKKKLTEQLELFAGLNVEEQTADIIRSLEETEAAITQAANESKELLGEIIYHEEKAAECGVLQSRYQSLRGQYTADIKRLTFIVNGEVSLQNVPQNTKCPYCEGKISSHDRKSYIDTARAELGRIVAQLDGLQDTEADVAREKEQIRAELEELTSKRTNIEQMKKEEFSPKADELKNALEAYRVYIQLKKEVNIIEDFAGSWAADLRDLPDDDGSEKLEYHPRDYFDDSFRETMDNYAKEVLKECNYEDLTAARFNIQDFDIEVNGLKKATNHGKGYRSFLNTAVALMFRKYIHEHAKYKPDILIIDTPLLGLDQGVDDAAPESMRTALFKYFMNHQTEGQLIVIENLEHIPDLDYEAAGANVITFTKGRYEGRYGFLADVQ